MHALTHRIQRLQTISKHNNPTILPRDIIKVSLPTYSQFKVHNEELITSSTMKEVVIKQQNDADRFQPILECAYFPCISHSDSENIMSTLWQSSETSTVPSDKKITPYKFIIAVDGLNVFDLQAQALNELYEKEVSNELKYIQSQLVPDVNKILQQFVIKNGPPLDEIPVERIGATQYSHNSQIWDMHRIKDSVLKDVIDQYNNGSISAQDLRIHKNEYGDNFCMIQICTSQFLMSEYAFQIPEQPEPSNHNRSFWYTIYDLHKRNKEQQPLQKGAHFITQRIYGVPSISIEPEEFYDILTATQNKEQILWDTFNIHMQQIIANEKQEKIPRTIIHERLDISIIVQLYTMYPISQIKDLSFAPLRLHIKSFQLKVSQLIQPPCKILNGFQTMNHSLIQQQQEIDQLINDIEQQIEAITLKYSQCTKNKLQQQIQELKTTTIPNEQTITLPQDRERTRAMNQIIEQYTDLIENQVEKLTEAKQLQTQLTGLKQKQQQINELITKMEDGWTPLIQQTFNLGIQWEFEAEETFLHIIIGPNKEPMPETDDVDGALSMQANSTENLMILNFRNGSLKFKPRTHWHRYEKITKAQEKFARNYYELKRAQLMNTIKKKINCRCSNVLRKEVKKQYLEYHQPFQYTIEEILMITHGILMNDEEKPLLPRSFSIVATTEYKCIKLSRGQQLDQMLFIDKKNKTIYLSQSKNTKQLQKAIHKIITFFGNKSKLQNNKTPIVKNNKQQKSKPVIKEVTYNDQLYQELKQQERNTKRTKLIKEITYNDQLYQELKQQVEQLTDSDEDCDMTTDSDMIIDADSIKKKTLQRMNELLIQSLLKKQDELEEMEAKIELLDEGYETINAPLSKLKIKDCIYKKVPIKNNYWKIKIIDEKEKENIANCVSYGGYIGPIQEISTEEIFEIAQEIDDYIQQCKDGDNDSDNQLKPRIEIIIEEMDRNTFETSRYSMRDKIYTTKIIAQHENDESSDDPSDTQMID